MALCHAVASGEKTSVADRESGVALCHGVPAPRSLTCAIFFFARSLTLVPRSLLLNRTETLATQAIADRERSVALCHRVALKKKGSVADRESGVTVPLGGVKKKKK